MLENTHPATPTLFFNFKLPLMDKMASGLRGSD